MMYKIVYTKLSFSLLSQCGTSWVCYLCKHNTPLIYIVHTHFLRFILQVVRESEFCTTGNGKSKLSCYLLSFTACEVFQIGQLFHNFSFYRCVTCFLFWMLLVQCRTKTSSQIESHALSRYSPFT